MNPDPASLDNLRDIVELPPVSWWPLAPGWWVVFIALAVVAAVYAVGAWKRWKAHAYRRAALRELESATSAAEIAAILKRTALCAFPRAEVASLSGTSWYRWLGETGGAKVPTTVERTLTEIFQDRDSVETTEATAFAASWIKNHKVVTDTSIDREQAAC